MKKLSFLITTFLFSTFSQAVGWHEVGKVTRVHSGHGNGAIYLTTEIQISNPSCQYNVGYTASDNATNSDRIYSLLISAYVSKTPVSIYVTDSCLGDRPQVNAVQFKDQGVEF